MKGRKCLKEKRCDLRSRILAIALGIATAFTTMPTLTALADTMSEKEVKYEKSI